MLTAPQLILTVYLLNFNWQDLTIGDFGFRISDLLKGLNSYFTGNKSALRWKVSRLGISECGFGICKRIIVVFLQGSITYGVED
jgi:hypothetical protein